MKLCSNTDRSNIIRAVPCCSYTESIAEMSKLNCRCKTAAHADMAANVVNSTVCNKALPLHRMYEKLAHCYRCCAYLTELIEPVDMLRCQCIFEIEQFILLNFLCKLHCIIRCESLMYIVEYLKLITEINTDTLKKLQ